MGSSNTNNHVLEEMSLYWNLGEVEEDEACCFASSLFTDNVKFEVLKTVNELNVFEIIKKSGSLAPMSVAEIVANLPNTNNPEKTSAYLGRLLEFLVSHAILTVSPTLLADGRVERRYGLAPVCKFLTFDEEGVSMSPFLNTLMHKTLQETCLSLKDAILEGKEPFIKAHGMSVYEYINQHPKYNQAFHEAMSSHLRLVMRKILTTYKGFENLSSLIDVGGGNGATLNMIICRYPTIEGINFDQPHIIADAPIYAGVKHVAGDIFSNIPRGDAIFLKWIMHCFGDEECLKILKNCYAALPQDHGKVIICEFLLPDPHEPFSTTNMAANSVVQLDVIMMVLPGGKERTKEEFKALAIAAGFRDFRLVCSAYNVNIMELLKTKE